MHFPFSRLSRFTGALVLASLSVHAAPGPVAPGEKPAPVQHPGLPDAPGDLPERPRVPETALLVKPSERVFAPHPDDEFEALVSIARVLGTLSAHDDSAPPDDLRGVLTKRMEKFKRTHPHWNPERIAALEAMVAAQKQTPGGESDETHGAKPSARRAGALEWEGGQRKNDGPPGEHFDFARGDGRTWQPEAVEYLRRKIREEKEQVRRREMERRGPGGQVPAPSRHPERPGSAREGEPSHDTKPPEHSPGNADQHIHRLEKALQESHRRESALRHALRVLLHGEVGPPPDTAPRPDLLGHPPGPDPHPPLPPLPPAPQPH